MRTVEGRSALVCSTNPDEQVTMSVVLPRWSWKSYRELALNFNEECLLEEGGGVFLREFKLTGPLLLIFDLRELLLASGIRAELS